MKNENVIALSYKDNYKNRIALVHYEVLMKSEWDKLNGIADYSTIGVFDLAMTLNLIKVTHFEVVEGFEKLDVTENHTSDNIVYRMRDNANALGEFYDYDNLRVYKEEG